MLRLNCAECWVAQGGLVSARGGWDQLRRCVWVWVWPLGWSLMESYGLNWPDDRVCSLLGLPPSRGAAVGLVVV